MFPLSRREFLKGTALLAAAASTDLLAPAADAAQEQTAPRAGGDRLNVAVVGVRGRGADHIRGFAGRNNCVVTHVCDVDTAAGPRAITAAASGQQGQRPTFERDLRRLMENRDIHIISIATPNHW